MLVVKNKVPLSKKIETFITLAMVVTFISLSVNDMYLALIK